jgi:hypothetical protein
LPGTGVSFTTVSGHLRFAAVGLLDMSLGLRRKKQRRQAGRPRYGLGQVLAATALLLRITIPILHPASALGLANDAGDLSAAFDEHALCLSGDRGTPDDPSDHAPKPVHHESAACCFWHGNTGLALAPGVNLELVAFARSHSVFGLHTPAPARRLTGAIGARAPPIKA